jgi:hypothetical protein
MQMLTDSGCPSCSCLNYELPRRTLDHNALTKQAINASCREICVMLHKH